MGLLAKGASNPLAVLKSRDLTPSNWMDLISIFSSNTGGRGASGVPTVPLGTTFTGAASWGSVCSGLPPGSVCAGIAIGARACENPHGLTDNATHEKTACATIFLTLILFFKRCISGPRHFDVCLNSQQAADGFLSARQSPRARHSGQATKRAKRARFSDRLSRAYFWRDKSSILLDLIDEIYE